MWKDEHRKTKWSWFDKRGVSLRQLKIRNIGLRFMQEGIPSNEND